MARKDDCFAGSGRAHREAIAVDALKLFFAFGEFVLKVQEVAVIESSEFAVERGNRGWLGRVAGGTEGRGEEVIASGFFFWL